jgi:outer membrane protein assembly factor BamD
MNWSSSIQSNITSNITSMQRRLTAIVLLGFVLVLATACSNKKVSNPLANVDSKQPDKVLFDRALEAMKGNKFEVARLSLQTLINTYPDSEYIARAKLGIADSWYAEGGTAALTQAEIEYKDFETFFPNMPEAAEAQLKIGNIHFQEMEKPDRDFTHALRAEDEYRQMILQYPDSKLLPQAKERLLEVQEVLGEREFRVGRFYYLRQSYPAAIARLRSVVEKYPLYSRADEGYYLLGQTYEAQIARIRSMPLNNAAGEAAKARGIEAFAKNAADAYAQIVKRYPMGLRAEDAKARLADLHQPVPQPTPEMIAQNKKEMESRESTGMMGQFMENFRRKPNMNQASKVGDPALTDPQIVSATDVSRETVRVFSAATAPPGPSQIGVETVKGPLGPSQNAPRSDAPPEAPANAPAPDAGSTPAPAPDSAAPGGGTPAAPAEQSPYGELKPDAPAADATPAAEVPLPAPPQTNEIQPSANDNKPPDSVNQAPPANPNDSSSSSSSKKKKGKKKFPF